MRKMLTALGALALAFGVSAVSLEPTQGIGFSSAQAQAKKAKAKAKKPAAKKAGYQRRCKKGERWNATATLMAGACQKVAKAKGKPKAKARKKAA